ncbi:MAG TPA: RNA polymerase sporulation sigma factor SigK [Firmicutes bacterium]|nr:RNA polymerase sporulation sigma factor SigK [Bacillota bacterium]
MTAFFRGTFASFPKPLSEEEESEYIQRCKDGDTQARDLLIEHNLRLVAHIAKKYTTSGRIASVDFDDIISIGSIGLIKAIDSFNSGKSARLATYAARCIENEILMYIRSSKKYSNDIFLQDPIGHDFDGNEITVMDMVKSDDDPVPDEVSDKIDITRMMRKIDEVLDEREREIIRLRYAVCGGEEMTQREIASMLGISRSYVSRIEKKALKKIASCLGE